MSKQKSEVAIVLTAEQAGLVDEVKSYHAGCKKAYEHQIQYAFLSGFKLHALKATCKNGNDAEADGVGFMALREQHLPDVSRSAAQRYMDFTNLVKEKLPAVGNFSEKHLLLTDGELPPKEKEAVLKAVYEAADGKTWTEFYRDLALVRQKQRQEHHPIKPLTPEEQIEAENAQAQTLVNAVFNAITMLRGDLENKKSGLCGKCIKPADWKRLHRDMVALGKAIKPLTNRKGAKEK